MSAAASIFEHDLPFEPAGDFEAFLKQAPGKWAVYLLADAGDQPIQLLCVKNLRASLKRRLGGEEMMGVSRKVNYREIVRRVSWRRVDSAFEADWVYLEAARRLFPQSYRGMVGFRPAWFIHVNPDADFPRYTRTIELTGKKGLLAGPVEDKHAAQRLIELVEDLFDLCRFYNILIEAPHGSACAYKEMGRCPAPCDGSISMDQYRNLIAWSAQVLIDPKETIRQQQVRMADAAAELRFETAGKIKQYISELSQLGRGAFRHVRRLEGSVYVAWQRGPRAGTAKVFLITPGQIEEVLGVIDAPLRPAEVLRLLLERAQERAADPVTEEGVERLGVVAHHLFSPKAQQGLFLPLETVDEKALARAHADLLRQKAPVEEEEGEGVMKELQAL